MKTRGARRDEARCHIPLFGSCNKVLKPNFQSIISQINNGCSLISLILAKLLLLDINCENIFALSIVTALTACPFSEKKYFKMTIFFDVKSVKIYWRLGATPPDPLGLRWLGVSPPHVRLWPPSLPNPGCATGENLFFCSSLGFSGKIHQIRERFRPTFSKKERLCKKG